MSPSFASRSMSPASGLLMVRMPALIRSRASDSHFGAAFGARLRCGSSLVGHVHRSSGKNSGEYSRMTFAKCTTDGR